MDNRIDTPSWSQSGHNADQGGGLEVVDEQQAAKSTNDTSIAMMVSPPNAEQNQEAGVEGRPMNHLIGASINI